MENGSRDPDQYNTIQMCIAPKVMLIGGGTLQWTVLCTMGGREHWGL